MYICQICKKKPATIHLTDIHNNIKKEVHICETCASEKGFNLQGASNLPQLLGMAAKKGGAISKQVAKVKTKAAEDDIVCPHCGISWSQFSERGRLGCPHDYQTLEPKIGALITNQIAPHTKNRETFHVGKKPGAKPEANHLDLAIRGLEKRLRQAVAEENYESAASLKAELDGMRKKKNAGE